MTSVTVDVVAFTYRPCGPFPCDEERSCGLSECYGKEKMSFAFLALKRALEEKYGDKVSIKLISLDNGISDEIKEIIRREQLPLPIILINGNAVPVGAVSVPRISEYIEKELK